MIDPVFLRENPELVKRSQEARGESPATVDEAVAADRERRAAITAFEELRAAQNAHGKRVAQAPKEEKAALVAEAKELSERVKAAQHAVTAAEEAADAALAQIENIVIDGVPAGGEDNFVTLRTHGQPPVFDFEPRDHLELGEMLDAIDMERGTKVSGSRFYFLKGIGARLEIALMMLALDRALQAGFIPLIPPTMVRPEVMRGTGFLGQHSDEVYHLEEDDLYLVGTSEVPLAGLPHGRDPRPVEGREALRRLVDLLPARGRLLRQGHPRHHPRAPVQQARDVRLHDPGGCRGRAPAPGRACRSGCCRTSASPTGSSTSPRATSAPAPRASTTSRPGCPRRARTAS